VVNTFVVFLARVVGFFVDKVLLKNNGESDRGPGIGYMVTVFVCEIMFGLAASIIVAWFSRQREFRADAGSAKLLGSSVPMQHALARLNGMEPGACRNRSRRPAFPNAGGWTALFSHPPADRSSVSRRCVAYNRNDEPIFRHTSSQSAGTPDRQAAQIIQSAAASSPCRPIPATRWSAASTTRAPSSACAASAASTRNTT
jgi:hypothetical protein